MDRAKEYENAYYKFISDTTDALLRYHPIFGRMQVKKTRHAAGFRNVVGSSTIDSKMTEHEFSAPLKPETIRMLIIEEHSSFIYSLATSKADSLMSTMTGRLLQICDATGNISDLEGKTPTADDFLDLIESRPMSFSKDGEPNMPSLITGPKAYEKIMQLEYNESHRQRLEQIIANKREAWNSRREARILKHLK